MISATTSAPGGLELFNLRVMNLRVIAVASFIASLETTSGAVEKSPFSKEVL
jgi:hypothetical protein